MKKLLLILLSIVDSYLPASKGVCIYSPSICILFDEDYIVSHNEFGSE